MFMNRRGVYFRVVLILSFSVTSFGFAFSAKNDTKNYTKRSTIANLAKKSGLCRTNENLIITYKSKDHMTMGEVCSLFSVSENDLVIHRNSLNGDILRRYVSLGPAQLVLRPKGLNTYEVELKVGECYRWQNRGFHDNRVHQQILIPLGFRLGAKGIYQKQDRGTRDEMEVELRDLVNTFNIQDGEFEKILSNIGKGFVAVQVKKLNPLSNYSNIKMCLEKDTAGMTLTTTIEDVTPEKSILFFSEEMTTTLEEQGYKKDIGGVYRKRSITVEEASESFGFEPGELRLLGGFHESSEMPVWYVWIDGACVVLREKTKNKGWRMQALQEMRQNKVSIKNSSLVDVELIMGEKEESILK